MQFVQNIIIYDTKIKKVLLFCFLWCIILTGNNSGESLFERRRCKAADEAVDLSGKRTELKKANCFLRLLNSEEAFLCPDSKENFEGSQKVNRKDEKYEF